MFHWKQAILRPDSDSSGPWYTNFTQNHANPFIFDPDTVIFVPEDNFLGAGQKWTDVHDFGCHIYDMDTRNPNPASEWPVSNEKGFKK